MAPEAAGEHSGVRCPRCESNNTKFCYYNNYSLSQPRHFCKACRRYWTQGGSLRNIPLGGASRKIKKPSRPSSSSSATDHLSGNSPAVDFQVAGSGFYPTTLSPFGDHQMQLLGAAGGPILDLLPDIHFTNNQNQWKEQRIALPLLYGTGDKDKDYQKREGVVGPADLINSSSPILLSQDIISNPHLSYHHHHHQHADMAAAQHHQQQQQEVMISTPPPTAATTPQWLFGGDQ